MQALIPSLQSPIPSLLWLCLLLIGCTSTGESGLSGRVLLIDGQTYPEHRIGWYELGDGGETAVFQPPEFSQIYQLTVTPDQSTAIFSYSPPPSGGGGFFDRSALYTLDLTTPDTEPERLLGGETPGEYLLMPAVGVNGRYLFYSKQKPQTDNSGLLVTLERYDLQTGENQPIVFDGIWPRVSPDGETLVFIGVDPQTLERALVLTNFEGSEFRILVDIGTFFDIDAPIFSPDGEFIYFSVAPEELAGNRNWFDKLLGVQIAAAHADHNAPSDWWRIPTAGGPLEQLTFMEEIILHGDFDPTTNQLIFTTRTGLYTLDGENNVQTLNKKAGLGTLHVLAP